MALGAIGLLIVTTGPANPAPILHTNLTDSLTMLSSFSDNFRRVCDTEQLAIDSLNRGGLRGDSLEAHAELYCQTYEGEHNPPGEAIIACRIVVNPLTKRQRFTFTLNGRRIARHKIALALGSLGA